MKTKNKVIALVEIAIVLCLVFLMALPAVAAEQNQEMEAASAVTTASEDDYVLGIYGNANEDDTIDMGDVVYTKLAIFGKKPKTKLCDAKYDGRINVLDVIQTKLIILGKEKEITFVDGADRTLTVRKPIKRIVVFRPYILETMRSLMLEKDKIVGVDKKGNQKWTTLPFPEFSECPDVGSLFAPNYEAVLELHPDAVFIVATFNPSKMEEVQNKLESLDPNIKVIRFDCFKPLSYIDDVRKMGYILGKKEEADKFVEFYGGWLDTIKEGYKDIPLDERPKVYFGSTSNLYKTGGKGSGYHEKVEMAGGNNIFSDLSGYPKVDPEAVVKRNPEIIVKAEHVSGCGYATNDVSAMSMVRDDIMGRPELAKVIAVKNEYVYIICNEILGGAQHFIGIAYMAKWFHPELFTDMDPKAIHQEYLTEFQGLDYDLDKRGVFVYHPEEHPDGH